MIHAILAIRPRWLRDKLRAELARFADLRIAAYAGNEFEVAAALHKLLSADTFCVDDPVIVVTSIKNTLHTPDICTRILTEFPEVTIFAISPDSPPCRSFQLQVAMTPFECSWDGLVDAIVARTRCIPPI